jgi:lipopolysaccharide/colanic/teichoic acid biosynthesis glycosyltransferase
MFDHDYRSATVDGLRSGSFDIPDEKGRSGYLVGKRVFDIVMSILLLPVLGLVAFGLLVFNPFFNRGPLLFIQTRMGKGCVPFRALKFRSMIEVDMVARRHDDPLEEDRITALGRFLRKSRLDELPQVFNVLKGEMSLIGPRPDYHEHALVFLEVVPGYRERHAMRPGISGLAQTELGYIEGTAATARKAAVDLHYIRHASFRLDMWIFVRTLGVVLGRGGK